MSDALCKCGHTSENHSGRCIFGGAGWCDCEAFDPQTADRDDLAAILAKHHYLPLSYLGECRCGNWQGPRDLHRAHVASMVLESDWLRDVKAQERSRIAFQFIGAWGGRIGGVTGQQLMQEIVDWINNGTDNTTDRTQTIDK